MKEALVCHVWRRACLIWRGTPHTLLSHVRSGTAELVMSHALLDELVDVIARRKFATILARTSRTPERI